MLPLSYIRFKSRPADPLRPPPRGKIDIYHSPEEGKFIARDWQGNRVTFDTVGGGGGGSSEWGGITGTLADQADLQAALDAKQASAAALTSWASVARASGFDTFAGTPSSANLRALLTDEAGTGSLYFTGGALGTPASVTLTNATGLPLTGLAGSSTLGRNLVGLTNPDNISFLKINADNTVSTRFASDFRDDLGLGELAAMTPASGIVTFLSTPSSANLRAAVTDEAGTGSLYFTGGALGTPASATLTNATGLPVATGISGLATGIATFLATPSSTNLAAAVTNETGSGALLFGNQAVSTGSIVTFAGLTVSASGVTSINLTTVDGDIVLAAGSGSTGSLALSGINTSLTSTGGGFTTISSASTGSMDNMTIGASTPADGTFSNLVADSSGVTATASKTAKVGGKIKEFYTDGGNVSTAETDLYSYTTEASLLGANGENLDVVFAGIYVGNAFTKQVKAYFGGTAIFDSGALGIASNSSWRMQASIIRVSASVVRYSVTLTTPGASTMVYSSVGELTGLTLSATNVLKITGTAGAGGASNDIVAKLGTVNWSPVSA